MNTILRLQWLNFVTFTKCNSIFEKNVILMRNFKIIIPQKNRGACESQIHNGYKAVKKI